MDVSNSEHKDIVSFLKTKTYITLRNLTEMPYGDYVWLRNNETEAVERKEIRDFLSSKFSGRLTEQLEGCLKEYNKVTVILEGVWGSTADGKLLVYKKSNNGNYYPSQFSPKVKYEDVIKALLSIRRYVEIIPTLDHQQSAEAILALSNGIHDADLTRPIKRRAFPTWTTDIQVIKLMNLVDRLPEKTAKVLIKEFGSIGDISELLEDISLGNEKEDAFLNIEGIGKGTIENLRKAIWNE